MPEGGLLLSQSFMHEREIEVRVRHPWVVQDRFAVSLDRFDLSLEVLEQYAEIEIEDSARRVGIPIESFGLFE